VEDDSTHGVTSSRGNVDALDAAWLLRSDRK